MERGHLGGLLPRLPNQQFIDQRYPLGEYPRSMEMGGLSIIKLIFEEFERFLNNKCHTKHKTIPRVGIFCGGVVWRQYGVSIASFSNPSRGSLGRSLPFYGCSSFHCDPNHLQKSRDHYSLLTFVSLRPHRGCPTAPEITFNFRNNITCPMTLPSLDSDYALS